MLPVQQEDKSKVVTEGGEDNPVISGQDWRYSRYLTIEGGGREERKSCYHRRRGRRIFLPQKKGKVFTID